MFIQPCFIRKNTPRLRKKLEELGYKDSVFDDLKSGGIITFSSRSEYSVLANYHFNRVHALTSHIDCGTNEELFLALSALRNDTDKNQWFTDGKLWEKSNNDLPSHYMQLEGHKATVEEIIEHFKDKYG